MHELDIQQGDVRELALFAGVGGGILGGHLLGWKTVCAVERDLFGASVLVQRQNDGLLPAFPIWSDVQSFDGTRWRGFVDVVSGGFPCQDISIANTQGKGLKGSKSGMWFEMLRIVREVEPTFVFIENVGNIRSRGLTTVLDGLQSAGYSSVDGDFFASDCGAPHPRKRTFILGWRKGKRMVQSNDRKRKEIRGVCRIEDSIRDHQECNRRGKTSEKSKGRELEQGNWKTSANNDGSRLQEQCIHINVSEKFSATQYSSWWIAEPNILRLAPRASSRVDRLKALGNIQVPAVAALAFSSLLTEAFKGVNREQDKAPNPADRS